MIVIWIIIALCGICSLILLSGRGSILIAGYNTMSKEEQEQYDEKKLCRITGAGMLVITVQFWKLLVKRYQIGSGHSMLFWLSLLQ